MATRRVELRAHFARTTSASAGAAAAAMITAINRLPLVLRGAAAEPPPDEDVHEFMGSQLLLRTLPGYSKSLDGVARHVVNCLAAAKVAEFALVADETPEQFWERTKKKIRALEKTVDVLMKRDPIFSELCWEAADNAIIWIGAENLASQFKDAPWSIVQTFFQTKLADLARDAYHAVQRTLQQEEEAARAQATGTLTTMGTELLPTPTHDESEGHGEGGATAGNSSGGGGKGGGGGEDSVEANDAQASGGGSCRGSRTMWGRCGHEHLTSIYVCVSNPMYKARECCTMTSRELR